MSERAARLETIAFWATVVVAALVIWIPQYPPPVDLPQHAGQVRFLHDWLAGDFKWSEHTELNLFTPYLLGYALGALLTTIMSAVAATKLVWSLAAIATVYTSVRLRRLVGGDPSWDWLLVPGLFGFAFTWGLFSFVTAVPLGLYTLERWIVYVRTPTLRNAAIVVAIFHVLFFGHVLVTAWVMLVGGVVLLAKWREVSLPRLLLRGLPLLAALPITYAWWRSIEGRGTPTGTRTLWRIDETRVTEFLPQWLGVDVGPVVIGVGLLLLVIPFVAGARFSRDPGKLAALAVTFVVVMVVPYHVFGNAFTYNRFFSFLGPALVIALAAPRVESRFRKLRVFLPALAIAWTLLFAARMAVFRAESEDFARIVDDMQPGKHVVAIVHDPFSDAADLRFAYLHFQVWYQAATGGFAEFSFANLTPCVVRFIKDYKPTIAPRFEFSPTPFDPREFDYILIRSANKAEPVGSAALRLVEHEGLWWLYAPSR